MQGRYQPSTFPRTGSSVAEPDKIDAGEEYKRFVLLIIYAIYFCIFSYIRIIELDTGLITLMLYLTFFC